MPPIAGAAGVGENVTPYTFVLFISDVEIKDNSVLSVVIVPMAVPFAHSAGVLLVAISTGQMRALPSHVFVAAPVLSIKNKSSTLPGIEKSICCKPLIAAGNDTVAKLSDDSSGIPLRRIAAVEADALSVNSISKKFQPSKPQEPPYWVMLVPAIAVSVVIG